MYQKNMDALQLRRKPKILLTNFSDEERIDLSNKIRCIGGILYESSKFTPLATHLVCKLPSRSEKFICACASGKWILSQSYVDESYKQNKWLDENAFEWSSSDLRDHSSNRELFLLPRKWRMLSASKKGAFSEWNVVLMIKNNTKKEAFKRLIEAGRGKVMNTKTPYNGRLMNMVNYVISDDIKCKKLLSFKRANIPVIDSEAVIDYIIKGKDPSKSCHEGANGIKNETRNSSEPSITKIDLTRPLDHFTDRNASKRQKSGRKEVQTTVTAFFTEIKNEKFLSSGKHPPCKNGDNSTPKKMSSVRKFRTPNREKVAVPLTERFDPRNKEHLINDKSVPKKKVCLKELGVYVTDCRDKVSPNRVESRMINSEEELTVVCSPIEKDVLCNGTTYKKSNRSSLKKNHLKKDNPSIKQENRSGNFNENLLCSNYEAHSKRSAKQCLFEKDPVSKNPMDVKSSVLCKENITSRQDTVHDANTVAENRKNIKQNLPRKRILDGIDIDAVFAFESVQRNLRSRVDQTCNAVESPSKKLKMLTDSSVKMPNQWGSVKPNHWDCVKILDPLYSTGIDQKRVQLHRYGTDTIESCLEEGLRHEAVQLMGSYLSPNCYLASNMISVFLKILEAWARETEKHTIFPNMFSSLTTEGTSNG